MSTVASQATGLQDGQESVRVVERGAVSWRLVVAAAVATGLVVMLPLGRSHFTGIMWLWALALLGVLGLNLVVPIDSSTGIVVKWMTLAGCLAFLVVFPIGRSASTLLDLGLFAVFGIVCIGTNLVHGFAGKVTLAQAAFLGIGAYVSVLFDTGREVSVGGMSTTLPERAVPPCDRHRRIDLHGVQRADRVPGAPCAGAVVGLRTLAFNLLVFLVLNNEQGLTGGSRGIRIPHDDVTVFGIDLFSSRNYYYFCLVFLVAATALVWWIVRSPWGPSVQSVA